MLRQTNRDQASLILATEVKQGLKQWERTQRRKEPGTHHVLHGAKQVICGWRSGLCGDVCLALYDETPMSPQGSGSQGKGPRGQLRARQEPLGSSPQASSPKRREQAGGRNKTDLRFSVPGGPCSSHSYTRMHKNAHLQKKKKDNGKIIHRGGNQQPAV